MGFIAARMSCLSRATRLMGNVRCCVVHAPEAGLYVVEAALDQQGASYSSQQALARPSGYYPGHGLNAQLPHHRACSGAVPPRHELHRDRLSRRDPEQLRLLGQPTREERQTCPSPVLLCVSIAELSDGLL